jgi:DHA2 family multidrug resistance protein
VLLPQYLQTVMGYSAEDAGRVMSPGGLVVMALMPVVGRLLGKIDARWLIAFGFLVSGAALYHMTSIYPGISFGTAVRYRMFQSVGLAFLFVPISTIAYVGIPPEKNNEVSGLTSLARNLGGGVGISLAQTFLARRAQLHQTTLVSHVTPLEPAFRRYFGGLSQTLIHRGSDTVEATRRAYAIVYGMVQREATTLAFIDTLLVLAITCVLLTPLVFLMRRSAPGAARMH